MKKQTDTQTGENAPEQVALNQKQITADMKAVEMEGVKVRRPPPGSVAAMQLHYFAEQEKISYIYPRNAGEKRGSFETYTVNNLMVTVQKGAKVRLPEDIASGFDNSRQITDAALDSGSLKDLPSELQN